MIAIFSAKDPNAYPEIHANGNKQYSFQTERWDEEYVRDQILTLRFPFPKSDIVFVGGDRILHTLKLKERSPF